MQATGGSKCQHALCFLTKISSTAWVSLRVLIFLISLFLSGGISTLSLVKFKNKLTLLRVYYKKFAAVHFCTHAESLSPRPHFFFGTSWLHKTPGTSAQHSKTLTSVPLYNMCFLLSVLWMAAPFHSHRLTMKWVWCAICCVQMLKEENEAVSVLVQAPRLLH